LTTIGDYSFCRCTSLTDVVIPPTVQNIGENTFEGCIGLKAATIGKASNIPNTAFKGCQSLTAIVYEGIVIPCEGRSNPFSSNITIYLSNSFSGTSFCGKKPGIIGSSFCVKDGTDFVYHWSSGEAEWEKLRNNGCIQNECNCETSETSFNNTCVNNDNSSRVLCMNGDECIPEENVTETDSAVVLELEDNVTDSNPVEIEMLCHELRALSNVSLNNCTAAVDYNQDGKPVRILVFVDDKYTANRISSTINSQCIKNTKP